MERAVRIKQVVPLLLLTHGLGILGGFVVFCFLFQTQCADLLQARESKYNNAIESLRNEYEYHTIDEIKQYQQKRLFDENALIDKHQGLLQAHEATLTQIKNLETQLDSCAAATKASNDEISSLKGQIEKSEVVIANTKRWATKEQEMLKNQLALTKTMLKQNVHEVAMLTSSDQSPCDAASVVGAMRSDKEEEIIQLQAAIRRRNLARTRQQFGETPTFRVRFTLAPHHNQPATTSTFEVEVDALYEMAHTVFTFLSLVESGLYDGTSIGSNGTKAFGGNPKDSIQKHTPTKLLRRYTELAYGSAPLLFSEVSMTPCGDFAFGVVGQGPDFSIQLGSTSELSSTCIGRIVDGREMLAALPKHERVTIIDARIVQTNEAVA